jgi:predicted TIM-barrel fold metal-dependent hydrolase
VGYEYLEIAARELGPEKLIFASSGPERDSRVERHRVRLLRLSAAAEEQVLGGNVARLLAGA